jgi:hypothetical protein
MYSLRCRSWNLWGSYEDCVRGGRGAGLRRGEYSSRTMGLFMLPLLVPGAAFDPGFATSRRSAEERVRSGTDGARFRLDIRLVSCVTDSPTDGEVRLMSSTPLVLEDVSVTAVVGGSDVEGTWMSLLLRGLWTCTVSPNSPSSRVLRASLSSRVAFAIFRLVATMLS